MTTEPRWDIIQSKPDFQKDLKYGKTGEEFVARTLENLTTGPIEVKSDRYRNGRMVVEIAQNPRFSGWKPSGLMITEAKWWVYVYAMDQAIVTVDIERLKRFVATLPESRIMEFASQSSNPSKGYLLEPNEVMTLLASSDYD